MIRPILFICLFFSAAGTAPSLAAAPVKESWDYAEPMKKVAARFRGNEGVVLHVGGSMTIANPYGTWPRSGKGKTRDDEAILQWMHTDKKDKTDGWWLCRTEVEHYRAYTSESGLKSAMLSAGGKRGLPTMEKLLDEYKPRMVTIECGIYDIEDGVPLEEYRKNMARALDSILNRGAIPILNTIPPFHAQLEKTKQFNEVLRTLAKDRGIPVIDLEREILTLRPDDWYGNLMKRIHLTASEAGGSPSAEPTAENLRKSGYLLRGWLTVRKIAEIKKRVIDDAVRSDEPKKNGDGPHLSILRGPAASGAEKGGEKFDPAVLKDLPDNSWIDLGLPWRGGNEIPAVFDAANQLFFKYGGCGDHSPKINVEGSKRPNEGYGNSCWVVNMAIGKWEMRRPNDVSFPRDRPGNGCSRCYAYDSKRKLIWLYGGISNGGGGGDQWDLWTYDGAKDTFKQWNAENRPPSGDGPNAWNNGGDTFTYDPVHDLFIMPRGKITWVYDPTTNRWQDRKTAEGPVGPGHYASMVFDVSARRLIYPAMEPTGRTVKGEQRPPATDRTSWKHKGGTYHECVFVTWTYDPQTNRWEKLPLPEDAPRPSPRWRFGLAYDSRNEVVILVGGSTDTWDRDEKNYDDVWVLKTATGRWTKMEPPGKKPPVQVRECRHCAYDSVHNVVLFLNRGPLWAYRYRK